MAEKIVKTTPGESALEGFEKIEEDYKKAKEGYAPRLKEELLFLIQRVKKIDSILGINSFIETKTEKSGKNSNIKTPLLKVLQSKELPKDKIVEEMTQFPASKVLNAIARYLKTKQLIENKGVISINPHYAKKKTGPKTSQ